MTTAPARLYGPNGQPVNGHAVDTPKRAAALPSIRFAPFPITLPSPAVEHAPTELVQPTHDPIAEAEAGAIRERASADAEARRIGAEAEAEAKRIKATEETRKLKLANDKAEARAREEHAAREARIAASNRKKQEEEQQAEDDRRKAQAEQVAAADSQAKVERSAGSWRRAALTFAIVCAVVALPVQMSAFWSPKAPWLLAAPLVLEGGAWVVLRGAAAAVDERRPHWHYRLIAWSLAFLAAGINLSHGLLHFDVATAAGTAFASLAGPGIWDLHEHGRIRLRDGKLTRAQAKEIRKAEKRAAAEKAAEEKRIADEEKAAEKAASEATAQLAKGRSELYPEEWKRALALAAALGEATVTEAVWRRAWRDLHAADPGETVDVVRSRNVASIRMSKAVTEGSEKGTQKSGSSQAASQVPPTPTKRRYTPPATPGVRRKGDTPRFVNAARKQASIAAKNTANISSKES